MAAMDLLGRRWTLRILWELRAGPLGARALKERCDEMSSSVLYQRLRELQEAGLLERDEQDGYRLTPLGASLCETLAPLDRWARRWADTTGESRAQCPDDVHVVLTRRDGHPPRRLRDSEL